MAQIETILFHKIENWQHNSPRTKCLIAKTKTKQTTKKVRQIANNLPKSERAKTFSSQICLNLILQLCFPLATLTSQKCKEPESSG